MLTMHVVAHSYSGPSIYDNREAFFYEVDGLPEGHLAQVVKKYGKWQTRNAVNRVWSDWVGEFATAEEALASLN
jgi:hypothetical protein